MAKRKKKAKKKPDAYQFGGTPGPELSARRQLIQSQLDFGKGLSDPHREWIADRLADDSARIFFATAKKGFSTSEGSTLAVKMLKESLAEFAKELTHRPELISKQLTSFESYYMIALTEWVEVGFRHAANIERAVQIFPRDEFMLWEHCYHETLNVEANHEVVYLQRITYWYAEITSNEHREAFIQAAVDFRSAMSHLGKNIVSLIIDTVSPGTMSAGRSAVKHYLRIVKDVYDGATAGDEAVLELGDGNKEDGRQLARLIWAALRNARVFEIDSDLYNAITVEASVHCWEKIGGIKKGVSFNDVSPEEGQAAFDKLWTAAESLPVFSDIMPFDHIFIGISGHGTNIPNDVLRCLIQDPPDRMIRACINGYLIGPVHGGNDVDVVVFVRITGPGGIDYTVPCVERMSVSGQPAEWTNVAFLFPWIVNSMLTFIHDHKTTIIESAPTHGIRRDYDRLAKQMGGTLIIPRPFYTVPMRDKVIINRAARKAVYGVQKRTPLTYRHDRRGHERCLIQRGQMPMAEETRTKLEKRGYKIFTINPVDAETNRLLAERRQRPKRADEWLATLVSWVTPTIVGPVDAPYVPAVRVSERFGGSR